MTFPRFVCISPRAVILVFMLLKTMNKGNTTGDVYICVKIRRYIQKFDVY